MVSTKDSNKSPDTHLVKEVKLTAVRFRISRRHNAGVMNIVKYVPVNDRKICCGSMLIYQFDVF
jgi:hypothetical protein